VKVVYVKELYINKENHIYINTHKNIYQPSVSV